MGQSRARLANSNHSLVLKKGERIKARGRPATRRRRGTSGQRRRHLPPPCFWRWQPPAGTSLPLPGRPSKPNHPTTTTTTSAAEPNRRPPRARWAPLSAPRIASCIYCENLRADVTLAGSPRTHTAGRVARAGGGAGGQVGVSGWQVGLRRSERRFRVNEKGKRKKEMGLSPYALRREERERSRFLSSSRGVFLRPAPRGVGEFTVASLGPDPALGPPL